VSSYFFPSSFCAHLLLLVIIASWDGEEVDFMTFSQSYLLNLSQQGLVGSTEYGEDFSSWISQHAVAYVNVDIASSGSKWMVSSSPSLAHIIKQTALDVPHPTEADKTLWDAREDEGPFHSEQCYNGSMLVDVEYITGYESRIAEAAASNGLGIPPLGSGSDFTVFLQRLGV
jgi:N-acetylated-alpha-linked acidic dipeptidase